VLSILENVTIDTAAAKKTVATTAHSFIEVSFFNFSTLIKALYDHMFCCNFSLFRIIIDQEFAVSHSNNLNNISSGYIYLNI